MRQFLKSRDQRHKNQDCILDVRVKVSADGMKGFVMTNLYQVTLSVLFVILEYLT